MSENFMKLAEQHSGINPAGYPPVHLWHPKHCGTMNLVIRRDGSWWHEGRKIERANMVRLFSRILRLEEDGSYVLVTPVEKVTIMVEDAPLLVVDVEQVDHQDGLPPWLHVRTATEDEVIVDQDHPLWLTTDPVTGEPSPYILIRAGLHARIHRNAFYRMVEWVSLCSTPQGDKYMLQSGSTNWSLGTV